MTAGFALEAPRVEEHAAAVAEIGARLGRVAAAGAHTAALSDTAYGLIGEVFAHTARSGIEQGGRDLTALADTAGSLARGLRNTAACYRQAERENAALFGGGAR